MSDRDISDEAVTAMARIIAYEHDPTTAARAIRAMLAQTYGIRLTVPAHAHDPNADWREPVQPSTPGDGYRAAREALRQQTGD